MAYVSNDARAKTKQTNKQTDFKPSDVLAKSETNCNDIFLNRRSLGGFT